MTDKELETLKTRADADDPTALYEYAMYLRRTDPEESDKYIALAAQLGEPHASECMGDKCFLAGDTYNAQSYYRIGSKLGLLDCSVKLAVIKLDEDESTAVSELEELAEVGISSACAALAEYYKKQGNRKQAAYWSSLVK